VVAATRILVIDDDANLRQTLALILEHAGYSVTASASAHEGLGCLEKQAFDLIFLDVVMPEMDGLALLPLLQLHHPHIPIMILTGNALPDPTGEQWPLGVRGFLSKPVDPEYILAQVSQLTIDKDA
jgi:CheY-like chemotaxis protein